MNRRHTFRYWFVFAIGASMMSFTCVRFAVAQDEATLDKNFRDFYSAGRYSQAEPVGRQLLSIAERNPQDPIRIAVRCHNLGVLYDDLGRSAEAEKLVTRAIDLRERTPGGNPLDLANWINTLGSIKRHQLAFDEATRLFQRALTIRETQLGKNHAQVAASLNNMALVNMDAGRLNEAERFFEQSMEIKRRQNPVDELDLATSKNNLASLLQAQGRHLEAERELREALAIRQKRLPANHADIANTMNNLGIELIEQSRYAEAETTLNNAFELRKQALPPTHILIASSYNALGIVYSNQGRFSEAEDYHRKALRIRQEALGGDHGEVLHSLNNLAILYKTMKRFDESAKLYKRLVGLCDAAGNRSTELGLYLNNLANLYEAQGDLTAAEPVARRSVEIARKTQQLDPGHLQRALRTLASVLMNQKQFAEAKPVVDEVVRTSNSAATPPGELFQVSFLQARVLEGTGQRDEAISILTEGMEYAEQQRILSAMDPAGRAAAFAQIRPALETLVNLQAEGRKFSELLATLERARARSLSDQLMARRLEPLTSFDRQAAKEISTRREAAQTDLSSSEIQLGLLRRSNRATDQQAHAIANLEEKISSARSRIIQIDRETYQQNPAWREIGVDSQKVVTLERTQQWLRKRKGLLLDYFVGERTIAVLVVKPNEINWFTLQADEKLAESLGMTPGPLDIVKLDQALLLDNRHILQRLARNEDSPETRRRLAKLFQLLFPSAIREDVIDGDHGHIFVIPDGPLQQLPFEALIVEEADSPNYFLDVAPPISYLPSLAWLFQSEGRSTSKSGGKQILTVGDPTYPPLSDRNVASVAATARFHELGHDLAKLPHTADESNMVADAFGKSGAVVQKLIGTEATENSIRAACPGKQLVHLACHGFVDQMHSNFFGALAVTPGKPPQPAGDDGMLMLSEIYQLNLNECELAILSACQTNFGPQQKGEGTWALTRGFLVAGSRRVVASNWMVDDEATANLVGYFCSSIAEDEQNKKPIDYVKHLHAAKRWVREHDKWRSPYYWAPFVLAGPN